MMIIKIQYGKVISIFEDDSTNFHYLIEVGDRNIYLSILFNQVISVLMIEIILYT